MELPPHLSKVHDVFHVSQLRRCFSDPICEVDHETLDLQDNLSYREYPVRILDQAERTTRRRNLKFLKVQWSNHSEKEATWEREDRLRLEYPALFPTTSKSRDEILLSGGELSHPWNPNQILALCSYLLCIASKKIATRSKQVVKQNSNFVFKPKTELRIKTVSNFKFKGSFKEYQSVFYPVTFSSE